MNEIAPGLYLGSFMAARKKDELKKRGITHILGIMEGDIQKFPDDFEYLVYDLHDDNVDLLSCFNPGSVFIKQAISDGGKVLVHCAAGISRSASMVTAHLMRENEIGLDEALELVKAGRHQVHPNPFFMNQLGMWEEVLEEQKRTQEEI